MQGQLSRPAAREIKAFRAAFLLRAAWFTPSRRIRALMLIM
jgi:hypothetical protein